MALVASLDIFSVVRILGIPQIIKVQAWIHYFFNCKLFIIHPSEIVLNTTHNNNLACI